MEHGWAIILFTILIKLLMSSVTYKSFFVSEKHDKKFWLRSELDLKLKGSNGKATGNNEIIQQENNGWLYSPDVPTRVLFQFFPFGLIKPFL
jgi:membrane protein insertase Oxa1/YidC/SpoIIIJ